MKTKKDFLSAKVTCALALGLAASLTMSFSTLASSNAGEIFQSSCAICHGADGKGDIPGTPDLTSKTGPLAKDGKTLHFNISNGFQSPGSTMAMPAKGGNPNLSDDEILALVKYMKKEFYVN